MAAQPPYPVGAVSGHKKCAKSFGEGQPTHQTQAHECAQVCGVHIAQRVLCVLDNVPRLSAAVLKKVCVFCTITSAAEWLIHKHRIFKNCRWGLCSMRGLGLPECPLFSRTCLSLSQKANDCNSG